MANKQYTVNVQGQDIQIPAWASESTMLNVAQELEQVANIDNKMLSVLAKYTNNSQDILSNVENMTRRDTRGSHEAAAQTKTLTAQTKGMMKRVVDSTSFLGNTDAPLTSLVSVAREVGGGLKDMVVNMFGKDGANSLAGITQDASTKTGKVAKAMSDNKAVMTDILFTWLGWNAGKLEAFAKVQQQMIDNGAIMFNSAAEFEKLRVNVNKNGVTYDAFAKTIAANGSAIAAFGGTTSVGTRNFQQLFNELDKASDLFGDFGLSSPELLQSAGDFLEYQRLTGGLTKNVVGLEEKLVGSFTKLQMETAGLASITGLSRSQALNAKLNITNVDYAAGLQKLTGPQFEAADKARFIFAQIETIAGTDSPFSVLSNALARTLAYAQGDASKININAQMSQFPEDLAALRRAFGDDFINELEQSIVAGDIQSVEEIMLSAMNEKVTRFGTGVGSVTDALEGKSSDLANTLTQIQMTMGNISTESLDVAVANAASSLTEAGSSTLLLNTATKAFLAIQNSVTLPMDLLSSSLESAATGIQGAIESSLGNTDAMLERQGSTGIMPNTDGVDPNAFAIPRPQGGGVLDAHQANAWDIRFGDTHEIDGTPKQPTPKYFGGPVSAGNPYLVNDGVDMSQAELFVPEVNGRILSNRELRDVASNDLTSDNKDSILEVNLIKEYSEVLEAKKKTLETMTNLKAFSKSRMLENRLNKAIDASGA